MKNKIVKFNFKSLKTKRYDQSCEELRAIGLSHPEGLLHNVGEQKDNNLVVIDVWESAEASVFPKLSL